MEDGKPEYSPLPFNQEDVLAVQGVNRYLHRRSFNATTKAALLALAASDKSILTSPRRNNTKDLRTERALRIGLNLWRQEMRLSRKEPAVKRQYVIESILESMTNVPDYIESGILYRDIDATFEPRRHNKGKKIKKVSREN